MPSARSWGVWFGVLGLSGLLAISQTPEILQAVSPHYALKFMLQHGVTGFFALQGRRKLAALAVALTAIDLIFFGSCMTKIPHGGYWSLILASFPFASMLLWTRGQRALYQALRPLDLETFLVSYEQVYSRVRIPGTALFFTREAVVVPPYVIHCMLRSNIVYERNIFISIDRTDTPFGVTTNHQEDLGPGLEGFTVTAGYMEILDIAGLLKANHIKEKVIFYGIEDISTSSPFWRLFAIFKKLTPNFVQFNKLPASRLQGVVTRVEM